MNRRCIILLFAVALAHGNASAQSAPWANNPALAKSFRGTYGVNTNVEPAISADDQRILDILQPLIEESRQDAIGSLEKYVDDKTNARFDLILANLYVEQQKVDKSFDLYQRALTKFPNFRAAHKAAGMVFAQKGQFEKAIQHFSRVIELGEFDGTMMGLLAQCQLSLGNAAEAETAFRQAALLQPGVMDWKRGVIAALAKQNRITDAIAQLDTLIARDPDNDGLLGQRAELYAAAQDFTKAAETLELLALVDRASGEQLLLLGDLYVNNKLPRPAVRAYIKALEKAEDTERFTKALEVLVADGALDEAEQLLTALQGRTSAAPDMALKTRFLKIKSRIASARHADDESAVILKEITEADPLDGDAWLLLGKYHSDKEDDERAIFAYERAASIESFRPDANVRLAEIYVSRKDFLKAVTLLEEAQRLKPRDSVARYLDQLKLISRSKS